MARIKIEDLPVLVDLSAKEKKGIFGGTTRSEDGTRQGDTDLSFAGQLESGSSKEADSELEGAAEATPYIPGA